MTRSTARTDNLPAPAGPYSHSVTVGGVLATAGQGGAGPEGALPESVDEQTRNCLRNVVEAVRAGGCREQDILKVTVYLTDVRHFAAMNDVYRTVFSEPYPARTTVYLTLPPGLLVEADALAVAAGTHSERTSREDQH